MLAMLIASAGLVDTADADPQKAQQRLKGSTFELRIVRHGEGVVAVSPAMVVDRTGLAVTAARPLVGAQSVTAVIPGALRPVDVQAMKVDTTTGLALVKLNLAAPGAGTNVTPAELAKRTPEKSQPVWLGAMHAGNHDIAKARFDDAAPFDDFNRSLQRVLNHGSLTKWIEVEGVVGPQHAGVPAFNDAGLVIGISVYTWQRRARSGAILSNEHITSLLADPPAEPLTWFEFDQAVGKNAVPTIGWPRVVVTQGRSADDLRRVIGVFKSSHECLRCNGEAVVTKRVKVGTVRSSNIERPVYENQEVDCDRCGGTGLNDADALKRALGSIAENTAHADRTDPKLAGAFETLQSAMTEIGEKHTLALRDMLMEEAKATIAAGPTKVGQPILVVGDLTREVSPTGFTQPVVGIGVGDRRAGRLRFVIDDARIVGRGKGEVAIVGGVLAGYVGVGEGKVMPVVSHGFVVPLANPQEEQ